MDCVFVKARKISKSLKGNRGSAVNYSKYLDRTLKGVDYASKGKLLASGIDGTDEKPIEFWKKAESRELQTKRKDTARFAKEYIVGLPHSLPIEEMKNISETISKELSKNGRVVSWYLHEPDKDDESNGLNFHTHFLMSEREYKSGNSESDSELEKFGKFKQRSKQFDNFQRAADIAEGAELARKSKLEQQRRIAENQCNEYFQQSELDNQFSGQRTEHYSGQHKKRNEKSNGYGCGFSR